jgi:hypothetical protein
MMNSPFVMQRIHQNNAGSRVEGLLSLNLTPAQIVAQMFQHTLARRVTEQELALYTPLFQQFGHRAATESLQWLLMNKLEFIFNY